MTKLEAKLEGPFEGRKWETWRVVVRLPKAAGRPWTGGSTYGGRANLRVSDEGEAVVEVRRPMPKKESA